MSPGWWVIVLTNLWLTHTHTHTDKHKHTRMHTQACRECRPWNHRDCGWLYEDEALCWLLCIYSGDCVFNLVDKSLNQVVLHLLSEFCIFRPNLMVLTSFGDELSCGHVRSWHTHTDTQIQRDRQTYRDIQADRHKQWHHVKAYTGLG